MSNSSGQQRPFIGTQQEIEDEISHFEGEVARFKSGDIPAEKFQGFRLRQGLYGQRGGEGHMLRLKLPYGRVDADQLEAIATVGDKYCQGPAHVTTRQDFQYHYVQLDDAADTFRDLAAAGVTTREACGNTVRNVTGCHYAGVCSQEIFDIRPYADAIYEFFLRHQACQNMPRKFKIALSGCETDCAHTGIHDIGLTSVVKDGVYGFRMVVGGGLGSAPRVAHLFEEFLTVEELLPASHALMRLFDLYGNRKQRARARMKFLVEKLGDEEFRVRYDEERAKLAKENHTYPTLPTPQANPNVVMWSDPAPSGSAYERWVATNTVAEQGDGLVSVQLTLPLGDLSNEQLRSLAGLTRTYSTAGEMRLTIQQNMVFISVQASQLAALYEALSAIDLVADSAQQLADVMSCPGAESCNLALTQSRNLGTLLTDHMAQDASRYDDAGGARVKISGCPNSCGHHHIASVGFHGTAKKNKGHMAPFYEVHLGGYANALGTGIANPTLRVPAQHGPKVLDTLLDAYRDNRQAGELFDAYVDRVGKASLKELLTPLTEMPTYEEDSSYYHDLGVEEEFALEDMGPGECAGGVLDLIEVGLKEARQGIAVAQSARNGGDWTEAAEQSDAAVFSAAQALLVTEGEEVELVPEAAAKFTEKFIATGLMPATLTTVLFALGRNGDAGETVVRQYLKDAEQFVLTCEEAYASMGNDLRLTTPVGGAAGSASTGSEAAAESSDGPDAVLDLKGVACPMNYVKTKLKLEMMPAGSVLEVLLDDGEPIENVPKSVANDGHDVVSIDPFDDGDHHRLTIRKS